MLSTEAIWNFDGKIFAAIPAGGQCWSLSQGASAQKCTAGSQCLPWLPDGGTWDGIAPKFCVYTAPLTYRQPCNYTERTQLCGSGFMCENGLCISSRKYKLNKWNGDGNDSYKRLLWYMKYKSFGLFKLMHSGFMIQNQHWTSSEISWNGNHNSKITLLTIVSQ